MAEGTITPEVLAAAIVLEPDHFVVEEGLDCATCAEPLEVGQQALPVYAPEIFNIGDAKAVWDIHLRCYQGEPFPQE